MGADRQKGLDEFGFPVDLNIANNPIMRIIKAVIAEEAYLRQSTLEDSEQKEGHNH